MKFIKQIILFLNIFFLLNCSENKDNIVINYTNSIKLTDNNGFPLDSFTKYFPSYLFYDTIKSKIFKDSVLAINDESFLFEKSYMLFKMKEPVLSDHYLGRDIYRIISLRSFEKPLIIRIDKYIDSILITVKQINREITYPFMFYCNEFSIINIDSIKEKINYQILFLFYSKELKAEIAEYNYETKKYIIYDECKYLKFLMENNKFVDSIMNENNNTNYYSTNETKFKINNGNWIKIQKHLDSAYFWETEPNVNLEEYPSCLDGSKWIIEGHSKNGYQIKILSNPNFESNNNYVKFLLYIMQIAELKNEKLY
jgi:hypothetical protein